MKKRKDNRNRTDRRPDRPVETTSWATMGDVISEALKDLTRPKRAPDEVKPPKAGPVARTAKSDPLPKREFGSRLGGLADKLRGIAVAKAENRRAGAKQPSVPSPQTRQPNTLDKNSSSKERVIGKGPATKEPSRSGKGVPTSPPHRPAKDPIHPNLSTEAPKPVVRKAPPAPYRSYVSSGSKTTATSKRLDVSAKIAAKPLLLNRIETGAIPRTGASRHPRAGKMKEFLDRQKNRSRDSLPINIGIDLGTGYTKVVWRDLTANQSRPLAWTHSSTGIETYLLPSVIGYDKAVVKISSTRPTGESSDPSSEIRHFKMCVGCVGSPNDGCGPGSCHLTNWEGPLGADALGDLSVEILTAYFLARVIAESRSRIQRELSLKNLGKSVHWSANVGIPVKHLDEPGAAETFNVIVRIAWILSGALIGLESAFDAREVRALFETALAISQDPAYENIDCFTYPEFAAQVAAATLGRSARDGLFAFIDVGAGTLDATVFRLYSGTGESALNTYDAGVSKLGAAYLRSSVKGVVRPATVTPESLGIPAYEACDVSESGDWVLAQELNVFRERIDREFESVIRRSYAKEPRSKAWESVDVFLGGGGSAIEVYEESAEDALGEFAGDLRTTRLPVPADLELDQLPQSEFHRLAVAYGLSHEHVNLPEIALPREVRPVEYQPRRRERREAITKDVC